MIEITVYGSGSLTYITIGQEWREAGYFCLTTRISPDALRRLADTVERHQSAVDGDRLPATTVYNSDAQ